MVKAFGWNPKDAGSSPAWHYSFPCIRLLLREIIIYFKEILVCEQGILFQTLLGINWHN